MKCFLSHSSSDKKSYVNLVAEKLHKARIVYDQATFEDGMITAEEILKGLDVTDVFVLFISNASLNSDWVRKELIEAHSRLTRGDIERIYPIIIDSAVTHDDSRIPEWMRNEYNLRLISRPTTAARRIEQRLRELSWKKHPKIRDKEKIFVGRNTLVKAFEERIDDISKETPRCIFAFGLKKIGRRAFLKHALQKTNDIDSSYDPLRIHLTQDDGIEGFIVKLYDLGVTSEQDLLGLTSKKIGEKTKIAIGIVNEIAAARDIVLIEDDGTIVDFEGNISEWFSDVVASMDAGKTTLCIAATNRIRDKKLWRDERIFTLNIPELESTERAGLLRRYSELDELHLAQQDFAFVAGLLTGYPDQVFYAVDLIDRNGLGYVKNNPDEIIDFSKNRAAIVMRRYEADEAATNILRFLSGFEFVSYKLIDDILDGETHKSIIENFILESICEEVGSSREYVRVNDVIRDYVTRNKLRLPEDFEQKLREKTSLYLQQIKSDGLDSGDASEYLIYLRTALLSSKTLIDDTYLIPAHFLIAIRELYAQKRHHELVTLCDKVLQKAGYLEPRIEFDIRYYLCLALARLKQNRFLQEVQKIKGSEHQFLLGFYYRNTGRFKEAAERQREAMKSKRSERRASRELVTVYIFMEDFVSALALARDSYERFPLNAFTSQAYFHCLIQEPKSDEHRKILTELINGLRQLNSEVSLEMMASARAQMAIVYDLDEAAAMQIINDAIVQYPNKHYPMLTKMDIAMRTLNKQALRECHDRIKKDVSTNSPFYNLFKKAEATLLALDGHFGKAVETANTQMPNYSETARRTLLERIDLIKNGALKAH